MIEQDTPQTGSSIVFIRLNQGNSVSTFSGSISFVSQKLNGIHRTEIHWRGGWAE